MSFIFRARILLTLVHSAKTFGRKLEYYEYVGCFASDLTSSVPKSRKGSKSYRCVKSFAAQGLLSTSVSSAAAREYLEHLFSYLMTFYDKTQPLGQAGKQIAKVFVASAAPPSSPPSASKPTACSWRAKCVPNGQREACRAGRTAGSAMLRAAA